MQNHSREYDPRDVQILLGDLNTTPNTSEIYHILENGLVDVWSGPLPDETGVGRYAPKCHLHSKRDLPILRYPLTGTWVVVG